MREETPGSRRASVCVTSKQGGGPSSPAEEESSRNCAGEEEGLGLAGLRPLAKPDGS